GDARQREQRDQAQADFQVLEHRKQGTPGEGFEGPGDEHDRLSLGNLQSYPLPPVAVNRRRRSLAQYKTARDRKIRRASSASLLPSHAETRRNGENFKSGSLRSSASLRE